MTTKTSGTQTLQILQLMYDGEFWSIPKLAKKAALTEQATRNRLDDMVDHGWAEKFQSGNSYIYRLTTKALLPPAQLAIKQITEKINDINVGARRALPGDSHNSRNVSPVRTKL